MSETKMEPINLGSIARGALMGHFETALARISANIADPTTPALVKRKMTLEVEFEPDMERRGIDVTVSATCKLAGSSKSKTRVYTGKDENGQTYLFNEDPRQELLFKPDPPKDNMIDFARTNAAGQ